MLQDTPSKQTYSTVDSSLGRLGRDVIVDPAVRAQLLKNVATIARDEYLNYKERFESSLSPFDRETYREVTKIPYAAKDWWRDPHDIIVTWSISLIISRENQFRDDMHKLPQWLVTAALLHDRGYGLLAAQDNAESKEYKGRGGAHWENVDTRIVHSKLSRLLAEHLFFKSSDTPISQNSIDAVTQISQFPWIEDKELFLEVIEKHDHPLIGKISELPTIGRHHFDADSLYSISLSSFVKDYLSYLSDPAKLQTLADAKLFSNRDYRPKDLLAVRMARYFENASQLPRNWDQESFPLNPRWSALAEGGMCIVPFSATALAFTHSSFHLLAQCCRDLEKAESVEEFSKAFSDLHAQQYSELYHQIITSKAR